MKYEVVNAKSPEEAVQKASIKVGDLVRVTQIQVSSAGPNQYAVMPTFEPIPHLLVLDEAEAVSGSDS